MSFFLLSCEHYSNRLTHKKLNIPQPMLRSHRGFDLGAAEVFHQLVPLADFSLHGEISRLVVDLNRSPTHPQFHSQYTKNLTGEEIEKILKRYYFPYRLRIEEAIVRSLRNRVPVVHFSIHSFTPVFNGVRRNADVGLLYDPRSIKEKKIAALLKSLLTAEDPTLRVRMNYPYRGTADGLTTHLRKRFGYKMYAGIEIEFNQAYCKTEKIKKLIGNLKSALNEIPKF